MGTNDLIIPAGERQRYLGRTEVLEHVRPLAMHGGLMTAAEVCDWYGVSRGTLSSTVYHHRAEFTASGYEILSNDRLAEWKEKTGIKTTGRLLGVFTRRAILLAGMLLAESETARRVRSYLLNTEELADDITRETAADIAGIDMDFSRIWETPGAVFEHEIRHPDGRTETMRVTNNGRVSYGGNRERPPETVRETPLRVSSGAPGKASRSPGKTKGQIPGKRQETPGNAKWKASLEQYGCVFHTQVRDYLNDTLGLSLTYADANAIVDMTNIDKAWLSFTQDHVPRFTREALDAITESAKAVAAKL